MVFLARVLSTPKHCIHLENIASSREFKTPNLQLLEATSSVRGMMIWVWCIYRIFPNCSFFDLTASQLPLKFWLEIWQWICQLTAVMPRWNRWGEVWELLVSLLLSQMLCHLSHSHPHWQARENHTLIILTTWAYWDSRIYWNLSWVTLNTWLVHILLYSETLIKTSWNTNMLSGN